MTGSASLGGTIRTARLAAGLSQEALAERAGISPRTVSDVERGLITTPRAHTLRAFSDALTIPLEALTGPSSDDDGGSARIKIEATRSLDELLRSFRRRCGQTQRELAQVAGVGERTISDIERCVVDRTRPRTAALIAQALGLEGEELSEFMTAATRSFQAGGAMTAGLVGREREINTVIAALSDHRIVTVTGPGGVGKTSLAHAIEINRPSHAVTFSDTAVGCDLSDELLERVGQHDASTTDLAAAVTTALGGRSLLILDNLEQLAGLDAIEALVDSNESLTVLATSRSPLRIRGEHIVELDGLDVSSASEVFFRRARESAGVVDVERDRAAIEEICNQVACLPFAVELAAARTRYMAPRDILARLDQPLSLLSDRSRGRERHGSVESSIRWSLDLLSAPALALFDELAIHPDGFSIDIVDAVHGQMPDVIDAMAELLDAHLVNVDVGTRGTRYRMHATVREVAARRLADDRRSALRARAADYVLDLVVRARPELVSHDQQRWLRRLDADERHFEPTIEHLLRADPPAAATVAAMLWRYWQLRGEYRRGSTAIRKTLAAAAETAATGDVATLRYGLAVLIYLGGDGEQASDLARSALRDYEDVGDEHGIGSACSLLGMIDRYSGQLRSAIEWFDRGLRSVSETGSRARAALLSNRSVALGALGDRESAIAQAEDAAARFEVLGDRREVADQLCNLGGWRSANGEFELAADLLGEAIEIFTELEEPQGVADATSALGTVWLRAGDVDRARRAFDEAADRHADLDDDWGIALTDVAKAELALLCDDPHGAMRSVRLGLRRAEDLEYWDVRVRGLVVRGLAHVAREEIEDAASACRSLIELVPSDNADARASAMLLGGVVAARRGVDDLAGDVSATLKTHFETGPALERRFVTDRGRGDSTAEPDVIWERIRALVET